MKIIDYNNSPEVCLKLTVDELELISEILLSATYPTPKEMSFIETFDETYLRFMLQRKINENSN